MSYDFTVPAPVTRTPARQQNPYAPPTATVADVDTGAHARLAERGTRLGAAMIDGLVMLLLLVPPAMLLGMGAGDAMVGEEGAPPPAALVWIGAHPVAVQLISAVVGMLVFVAVNGYWLHTRGQTVGKRLLGIRILRSNGERATLSRIVIARYLPTQVAGIVPGLGALYALVDCLLIYRDSRQCLHDTIADTIVVKD
jgi:uncharacterized RDD family membrane protein YckC